MTNKSMCVYILASGKHGTIYVGVTSDLLNRIRSHKSGALPGFTKSYGVDRLVYVENYDDPDAAIAREKVLKKWQREWKINLIEADNPNWDDLAHMWDHPDFRPDWNGIEPPKQ